MVSRHCQGVSAVIQAVPPQSRLQEMPLGPCPEALRFLPASACPGCAPGTSGAVPPTFPCPGRQILALGLRGPCSLEKRVLV